MAAKEWTLERVKKEVRRLDPNLSEDEDYFKTAVMMISALIVGTNIRALAHFTGLPTSYMRGRAAALRASGVWKSGKTSAEWFDKKAGGMAFWMDVSVAEGMLQRTK